MNETLAEPDLYTPGLIFLATLIGSPIAGGVLLARNYRHLGEREKGDRAWFWSGLSTIVYALIVVFFTARWLFIGLTFADALGMFYVAKHLQKKDYPQAYINGGKPALIKNVFLTGVLWLVAVLGFILGADWLKK